MSRENERIRKKIEVNPVSECNKVQKRFYPELFHKFSQTYDPRHQSYVVYTNKTMLCTLYYKGIAGIPSMQAMTTEFNDEAVVKNLSSFMDESLEEYLPHHVTENEYLERLDPQELQKIQQDIVYQFIRKKTFDGAKFMKKWLVIIDGSQLYSGRRKINDNCLERVSNRGTDQEIVNYHQNVLEAKIYFGEKLIASIATEFIENNGEDAIRQKNMSEEEKKQDCETKAFVRMAKKLKEAFPRLPMILLLDSLYASKTVMDICKKNKWDYIIRFKKGSIPSIAVEYEAIPEKQISGNAEFINDIEYKDHKVNVLRYREEKIIKKKLVTTEFQWLTNIKITIRNAEKMAATGRKRWKIENEGFNRQKHWQGDITHACSWNENAQKNHYLMHQISDFIKQLYEFYFLEKNQIKKKQKNISSDLLASFAGQLTREDISANIMEAHSVAIK